MQTFFTVFQECEIKGDWSTMTPTGSGHYAAKEDNAIVRLVRQDGLKRNFAFRRNSVGYLTPMMPSFDMIEELTVDEDERTRTELSPKLKFT
jgi:hypothetical protein